MEGRKLDPPLVLASASPQRRAILERLGVAFAVRPTDVVELGEGHPVEVAAENAMRKARAARRSDAHEAVLGVDTLVALDGQSTVSQPMSVRRGDAQGAERVKAPRAERPRAAAPRRRGARRGGRHRGCLPPPERELLDWYVKGGSGVSARVAMRSRAGARFLRGRSRAMSRTSWACRWRRSWTCIPSFCPANRLSALWGASRGPLDCARAHPGARRGF